MFTQLVKNLLTLERYRNGPFAQEREQYLTHLSQRGYAETNLAMKAKALAACDPGIGRANTQLKWRDDPNLMQFLRSLQGLTMCCGSPQGAIVGDPFPNGVHALPSATRKLSEGVL